MSEWRRDVRREGKRSGDYGGEEIEEVRRVGEG